MNTKNGNLKINSLAFNTCFSYRNAFQIASMLCPKKKPGLCQKVQNFVWFGPYDFVYPRLLKGGGYHSY